MEQDLNYYEQGALSVVVDAYIEALLEAWS